MGTSNPNSSIISHAVYYSTGLFLGTADALRHGGPVGIFLVHNVLLMPI